MKSTKMGSIKTLIDLNKLLHDLGPHMSSYSEANEIVTSMDKEILRMYNKTGLQKINQSIETLLSHNTHNDDDKIYYLLNVDSKDKTSVYQLDDKSMSLN